MTTSLSTAEAIRCYQGAKIPLQGDLTKDELLWTLRRNQDIRVSCYHPDVDQSFSRNSLNRSDQYVEQTSAELREAFRFARSTSDFKRLTLPNDQEAFLHEVYDATNNLDHWAALPLTLNVGGVGTIVLILAAFLLAPVNKINRSMNLALLGGVAATGLTILRRHLIHIHAFRAQLHEANK